MGWTGCKKWVCEMVLQERRVRELSSYYDFLDFWTEIRDTPTIGGNKNALEFRIVCVALGSVTAVRWQ